MTAARYAVALGWPMGQVKAMTFRELEAVSAVLKEQEREQRIAAAHASVRKGR